MMRIPRVPAWAPLALLLPVLPGCSTGGMEWSVTRFHELSAIKGKSFILVPAQDGLGSSLEFKAYAQATAKKLTELGLVEWPQSKFGSSDYLVGLDYGIGPPMTVDANHEVHGLSVPQIIVLPRTTNLVNGGPLTGVQAPLYGVTGYETVSTVNYHRYVRLFIHEGHPGADGKFLRRYEGIAESDGASRDLTWLVPAGIAALLTEFPGTSGKSQTVQIASSAATP